MTDYQFDDSLKNMIRNHPSPVPDDMWERIIQKKDKDRKGFLFFFRWFTVLILGVCLGGYLLMSLGKQKPELVNHAVTDRDLQLNQSKTAPLLNKEEVRTEKNSMTDVQQPVPVKRGSYTSKTYSDLKKMNGNLGSFKDKIADSKQKDKVVLNSSLQKDSPAEGKDNAELNATVVTNKPDDSLLNATGVVNKPAPVVKPVPVKSPADSAQKTAAGKKSNDSAANKKWYLDIYASPDWPMDHTENSSSSLMKLSYTVGLRINLAFGEHFSGKIGIQYSQINFGQHDSIRYLNGKTNHLNSFDLPVLAGYSFGDEKLKMTVTAGGIANLYSFANDSVYSIFKTNTGFSLYVGFNLEKKINQKISIYLEPYYRYRLTSMTIEGVDYFKFIDVVGLSFGARFYFLKPTKK